MSVVRLQRRLSPSLVACRHPASEARKPVSSTLQLGKGLSLEGMCIVCVSAEAAMSPIVPGRVRQASYPDRPCLLQQLWTSPHLSSSSSSSSSCYNSCLSAAAAAAAAAAAKH
ncbi:hypothetical protein CesoFtcFv8_011745 [Champsocephalus esox]|uniref:Uncharacterized protein n=1 Tax=Champsocephalus esox TaxID=159716 RepID=A0AAN8C395_9TELE|nr:hypothetical protein CesoFtcFv8_011745 [Champsocephalus esox]